MWVSGKYRSSEAIKSIFGCVHPLVSRILPYIGTILNKPQEQADGLVAGSLDLNAPADVVKAIYDVSFNAVINIILQSDDHSEIQTARPQIGKLWVSLCWKLHSSTDFAFTITDSVIEKSEGTEGAERELEGGIWESEGVKAETGGDRSRLRLK
ncbi:hypothetical protein D0Y65_009818 [Glycine soja]|uniref:Uncharacterized protein n=1 Tax=Glycine soja TaxID=3848 RepID=A0A445L0L1_GLYSO|nr:hypothetical protein D0Y65_009818 [Glycine soja]